MKIKILKKITYSACSLLVLLTMRPVFAQNYNFITNSGLGTAANTAGYDTGATTSVESLVGSVIMALLSFVGVIFLGLVIYGAIIWMTAEGNDEKVKKAKSILTDSIIGLVITLSAYAITFFLINFFWG